MLRMAHELDSGLRQNDGLEFLRRSIHSQYLKIVPLNTENTENILTMPTPAFPLKRCVGCCTCVRLQRPLCSSVISVADLQFKD